MKPYYETELGKLYHGDCLEIMPELDETLDMILCDLPYGTTNCLWDTVIPFEPLWREYKRLIKIDGAIALTGSQPFTSALVMSNIEMFKYEWIWHKNLGSGFANAKRMPMKYHENILIFYIKQPTYNPQFEKYSNSTIQRFKSGEKVKRNTWQNKKPDMVYHISSQSSIDSPLLFDRGKYPGSIQKINGIANATSDKCHPTQKPIALFEYLIVTYTNDNDLIMDNCIGSGTTAVACENLNRRWIGIEREEKYCEIAARRIEEIASQMSF